MPPRNPTDPLEWLRHARSNLARAQIEPVQPEILFADLCFDAQQAAEKAIKGVLIARRVQFPKTHAVATLLSLAEAHGISIPEDVARATDLTPYAVATRYPGGDEDVERDEWREAVELASAVVRWAEALVARA